MRPESPSAWRLVELGFRDVYDYVGSKMDWIDADLPFEGAIRGESLGYLADRSAPSCRPEELVGAVRARVAGRASCVVNDGGIVLGLLPAAATGTGRVADVMEEGPSTYRPHVTATEILPQAERRGLDEVMSLLRRAGFSGLCL